MRVAVFHNLNSGGSLRALTYQVKYLRRFGHHAKIFTIPSPGFRNPLLYFLYLYLRSPSLHRQLARQIDSQNFDVVLMAHDHLTQSPYLLRYLKTPTVYYCNEPKRDLYESEGFTRTSLREKLNFIFHYPLKWIDLINTRHATTILANSKYSQKCLEIIYKRKVFVNYLGVDTKKFHPSKTPTSRNSNFYILSVGTLLPHKGFEFLVKSVSLLDPEYRHLIFVGNGGNPKYIHHLNSLSSSLRVNLTILENISDLELIHLYQEAAVFAVPFHHEPFGLVILESLACGTPVVAINEGGPIEISQSFPGKSPVTLSPRDTHLFSQAILKHFKKHRSSSFSQLSFIKNNWNWEKSVRELEVYLKTSSSKSISSHEKTRALSHKHGIGQGTSVKSL